jgi:hypothetical protein
MNLNKKDISHHLYPCYTPLENKDMLPGHKKSYGFTKTP